MDKSLNLQIGKSGKNQIPPGPTLPDNIRYNNRKSIRNTYAAMSVCVCVCVCMYVHACFILTEINAVARIQSLAVDTEVVFDGEVDGSRVQCVCFVCLYLREQRRKQIAQMCQLVWAYTAGQQHLRLSDLHHKRAWVLISFRRHTYTVCLLTV